MSDTFMATERLRDLARALMTEWKQESRIVDTGGGVISLKVAVGDVGHVLYVNDQDEGWGACLDDGEGSTLCEHEGAPSIGDDSSPEAVAEWVVAVMMDDHSSTARCEASALVEMIRWDSRENLIEHLTYEDHNGCYTDEDATLEWGEPHSLATLRACMVGLLSANPFMRDTADRA